MKRWIMVVTVLLWGWITCACAEEPRLAPPSNPAPAAKQFVELRVRMIERSREESQPERMAGRVLNQAEAKVFMKELTAQPGTKVLSEPCLHLEVGQKGTFRSGGEISIPVPSSKPGEQSGEEALFFGTALDATVTIPKPGLLSVMFQCEQSELINVGKTGVPGKNSRAVNTRVDLQNGQTVVLPGLIATRNVTTETRIPVLGDIPLVGNKLFTQKRTDSYQSEFMVLVTVTMIEPPVK